MWGEAREKDNKFRHSVPLVGLQTPNHGVCQCCIKLAVDQEILKDINLVGGSIRSIRRREEMTYEDKTQNLVHSIQS